MSAQKSDSFPRLIINIEKLKRNLRTVSGAVHGAGCSLMIVTKSFCACPRIVDLLLQSGEVDYLADSRIQNLKTYAGRGPKTVLLRLPQRCEIEEVVRYADISFNSELETARALSEAARAQKKTHSVVLMVDLGDLREGIFFKNEKEILETARAMQKMPYINLAGIAANLTCYGAIIPTRENLSALCALADAVESRCSLKLAVVSGGNSSSYYLLENGALPARINNLRLGDAFARGIEAAYYKRIPGTFHDAITLEAQIIELKEKPSMPIGISGFDAFGGRPVFHDRGMRLRAIAALGRQDTDPDGLSPLDAGIEVLGASSDHLLLDVSGCPRPPAPGDTARFTLSYGALLKAFTSAYVERVFV